jgi:hypothetical protein
MDFREDGSMSMFLSFASFLAMCISASQFFFCTFFPPLLVNTDKNHIAVENNLHIIINNKNF